MPRYIDADKFEQEKAYLRAHLTFPDGTGSLGYCAVLTSVQIKDAPTEDVAPVVHAHKNIATSESGTMFLECSNCRKAIDYSDIYCKYCGAIMDEEVEDG